MAASLIPGLATRDGGMVTGRKRSGSDAQERARDLNRNSLSFLFLASSRVIMPVVVNRQYGSTYSEAPRIAAICSTAPASGLARWG